MREEQQEQHLVVQSREKSNSSRTSQQQFTSCISPQQERRASQAAVVFAQFKIFETESANMCSIQQKPSCAQFKLIWHHRQQASVVCAQVTNNNISKTVGTNHWHLLNGIKIDNGNKIESGIYAQLKLSNHQQWHLLSLNYQIELGLHHKQHQARAASQAASSQG